jgi:cytoskeletal protein RodZ
MVDLELASRRKRSAISLEQISQATKIGIRSLEAIEAGEFQKLPGGVYSTSYIRQYARAIDFDESLILEHYYSVMGIKPEASAETLDRASQAVGSFVSRFLRHTSSAVSSSH